MKLFIGILVLIMATAISLVAGLFSVLGMMALFAGSTVMISIMMATLETSKVLAAGWLHHNWKNEHVSRAHKAYLVSAVIVLMVITSLGVFGFLSKAHLEQQTPAAAIDVQLQTKQSRLDQLANDKARQQQRLQEMDAYVASILKTGKANAGIRAQTSETQTRTAIEAKIDADDAEIAKLTTEMAPLKTENAGIAAKLGPLKYVAQLFGWKDPEAAVRLLILMLMFAFDPLAIVLMISGTITIGEALSAPKPVIAPPSAQDASESVIVPEIVSEEPQATSSLSHASEPLKQAPVVEPDVVVETSPPVPSMEDIMTIMAAMKEETFDGTALDIIPTISRPHLDTVIEPIITLKSLDEVETVEETLEPTDAIAEENIVEQDVVEEPSKTDDDKPTSEAEPSKDDESSHKVDFKTSWWSHVPANPKAG